VAAFPEEIPRRLIRMFSILGDVILDPFLGSGTALKVAMDLDRKFVGYEKLPQLTDIIKRKIGSNHRQVEFIEPGSFIKQIIVSRET
jgi:DNA modification methylase